MQNIIIENKLDNLLATSRAKYHVFMQVTQGTCTITYNGKNSIVDAGNCALFITNKMLQNAEASSDMQCELIYIADMMIRQSGPRHPYFITATLRLFENPVLKLSAKDVELCRALFHNFCLRMNDHKHYFYDEILRISARMLQLDFFNILARNDDGSQKISQGTAGIMTEFIGMLQNREYRKNREVAYFAKKLGVVPKYLSEISNRVSGFSASTWINRFAAQDIYELLRDEKKPSAEVAEMFHFTGTSYFNRYVKRYLGAYPNELRNE